MRFTSPDEPGSVVYVSGRHFKQVVRKASASQRAVLAQDLRDGKVVLERLTADQARTLAQASASYLAVLQRLSEDERSAIDRGYRRLSEFVCRPLPTDHELDLVGPERLWAALDRVASAA